jgi:hypothetical protein
MSSNFELFWLSKVVRFYILRKFQSLCFVKDYSKADCNANFAVHSYVNVILWVLITFVENICI